MNWMTAPSDFGSSFLIRRGFQLRDPFGRDVIKLASEHQFSVSKVAAALGLKVHQFKAALEAVVGMGPKEYFRHYRAVQARQLISEGFSLKDISDRLGFRYYTHFAAEIRSFYEISPRTLQKIIEKQSPRLQTLRQSGAKRNLGDVC
jgi:AraC-like DNA-binding protein